MAQIKICPACDKSFNCMAENIKLCQCSGIVIPEEAKIKIAKQYTDCLCKDCLVKLK